ncbi:hypothetical protein J6590_005054 [Homalodisca vitripennis]|nr:hypothetical protein J6590_005054 [Homalodisca vitripennis]
MERNKQLLGKRERGCRLFIPVGPMPEARVRAGSQSTWRRPTSDMALIDRARAAYHNADYNLAVSLFEECLATMEPSTEIYLDYAEALVQCGRLLDSLDVYSLCSRFTVVSSDRLKHVVSTFMELLTKGRGCEDAMCGLGCALCESVLDHPVTLTCGHTFCAACVVRDTAQQCAKCGARLGPTLETNVLVKKVVEKWFQTEIRAARLREEGNRLCQSSKFEEAIAKYDQALELVPILATAMEIVGLLRNVCWIQTPLDCPRDRVIAVTNVVVLVM